MKKNTINTLITYLNAHDIPELADVKAELTAQLDRDAAKAQANRELYDEARDVVLSVVDDAPMTSKEIFEATSDWPEGFTQSKLNYALRSYWTDVVERHENGKSPLTYTKA